MGESDSGDATVLLHRLSDGDEAAGGELYDLIYGELHRLARAQMARQSPAHTLQATALVHEAWIRLVRAPSTARDRNHFLALAARAMRNILVDHARAKQADKRGQRSEVDSIDLLAGSYEERRLDVIEIDDALRELEAADDGLARVVELRFFAGLTIPETARAMGVSGKTIELRWRTARAWLRAKIPMPPD